jgi:hypothetical protein
MKELNKWQIFYLKHLDKRTDKDYILLKYNFYSSFELFLNKMEIILPLLKKVPFDSQYHSYPTEFVSLHGKYYNSYNEWFRMIIVKNKLRINRFLNYLYHNWDQIEEFIEFCESKTNNKKALNYYDECGEKMEFDRDKSIKHSKEIIEKLYKLNFLESTNEISLDDTSSLFDIVYKTQDEFQYVAPKLGYLEGSLTADHFKYYLPKCLKNTLCDECGAVSNISYDNFSRQIFLIKDEIEEFPDSFDSDKDNYDGTF